MTRPISSYMVAPSIPKELECLHSLAKNLLWSWDHEIIELFIRLDPDLWERTHHNPTLMLGMIRQERVNTLSRDDAFLAQMDRAFRKFNEYCTATNTWYDKTHGKSEKITLAYFSAEFGLTESLPNYSGGLGVLSGDHLKSASDLGLPLVGVGLLYQQGYFRQYLNADGWQQERYPENDFYTLPLERQLNKEGGPVLIQVQLPGRAVSAQIWKVLVGRVPLYLLDTNIPNNSPDDQNITDQLYGGDREMRMMQEILLGIGGYRALKVLGITPSVFHLNEGHSAFLTVERCKDAMEHLSLSFAEAREAVSASMAFTTHTPVPAGNDYFSAALMQKYFTDYCASMGLSQKDFFGLGRQNPDNESEDFCMTVLALRMTGYSNGVSKLHGAVSQRMWQNVWKNIPVQEIPISWITNGVHAPTWISNDMGTLFDRYMGPGWREDPGHYGLWGRVHHIPDEELWRTHERRRERLVAFARNRMKTQLEGRGAPASEILQAPEILNPEALTIGFARRFATYKRSALLLRNPERLIKLLTDKDRPVQIIFAGKAHPHDNPGKDLIRQIVHFARRPEVRRRILFIEDYDMVVARYLVQGVDVWMNTPRRPMEASGTSGMKAGLNGAINLSVPDGWWDEAYTVNTGWAIGHGEEYADEAYQDEVESNDLYDLLEKEIVPLFYTRTEDGLPRGWISKMKTAMRSIGPEYNTNRMVREYTEQMYIPALKRHTLLTSDQLKHAKKLAVWKSQLAAAWHSVRIAEVNAEKNENLKVGDQFVVRAILELGSLKPEDVSVELFYGALNADGEIESPHVAPMEHRQRTKGRPNEFVATITLESSGRIGHTVRVLPHHEDVENPFRLGLMQWA